MNVFLYARTAQWGKKNTRFSSQDLDFKSPMGIHFWTFVQSLPKILVILGVTGFKSVKNLGTKLEPEKSRLKKKDPGNGSKPRTIVFGSKNQAAYRLRFLDPVNSLPFNPMQQ